MTSLGSPFQWLATLLEKNFFPNVKSKPPLMQLEAVFSCFITWYLGEETDPHLPKTSCQVVVEGNSVQPSFLQAKQCQLPQNSSQDLCSTKQIGGGEHFIRGNWTA